MCQQCKNRRETLKWAWRTLNWKWLKCSQARFLGIYFGPHGLWYGLRFHLWQYYLAISWKWKMPKSKPAESKWR